MNSFCGKDEMKIMKNGNRNVLDTIINLSPEGTRLNKFEKL